jgi:hypothetical protein
MSYYMFSCNGPSVPSVPLLQQELSGDKLLPESYIKSIYFIFQTRPVLSLVVVEVVSFMTTDSVSKRY